jgi:hypothetical protein
MNLTDQYRELVKKREEAIAIEASMREEAVVNHFATRGYKVLSTNDNQTRQVLNMIPGERAADILAEVSPQRLIIAEVKGSDLDGALTQLQNTARRAQGQYASIACKVFVRNFAPGTDSVDLRGGRYGYRALRVFHARFPGEWILYEYDSAQNTRLVEIGSEAVTIVFGPHV